MIMFCYATKIAEQMRSDIGQGFMKNFTSLNTHFDLQGASLVKIYSRGPSLSNVY